MALRSSGTFLFTRGSGSRVATPESNPILVILAVGTPSLVAFQGVRPVTRSISPRTRWVSCALKAGSASGFLSVLVWVGGAPLPVPPLPGFPLLLPPPPRSGRLGNVVAGNLCPLIGTLRCTDEDFSVDQSSGADDR